MTIDSTFKPLGATVVVTNAAVQPLQTSAADGVTTFRVRCLAAGYLTWGGSNVTAKGAPSAGAPSPSTMGFPVGTISYIEVPAASYFISSVANGFELTPGSGGSGGQ